MFFRNLNKFRHDGENDAEFARRLGVTRQVFSYWKLDTHRPQRGTFDNIITILGVTEEEFWTKQRTAD